MAWLGRTISKLDFRKELTNYINGQTTPSRVCITNQSGDIDSSITTVAELALLSGVSAPVQTQIDTLNSASFTITGAATSVVTDNLVGSRVVVSSSTGKLDSSSTTTSQLAYLDATSSVQAQLDGKQSSSRFVAGQSYFHDTFQRNRWLRERGCVEGELERANID